MAQSDWDLDSGNLVLDFANTAEFHASDQPDEFINSYADLVSWSEAAGILSKKEARALLSKSRNEPRIAAKALHNALDLRELIFRIFSAIAGDETPKSEDLEEFNRILTWSLNNVQIIGDKEHFTWGWGDMGDSFDSPMWPIAQETANLLTSQNINRVGECQDDRGCGYLFIDTSRNHSRRWCSMETCGNRAKAQRHYEKISQK
jgi:predicted RNA-binding Zn ribbon-like protein